MFLPNYGDRQKGGDFSQQLINSTVPNQGDWKNGRDFS